MNWRNLGLNFGLVVVTWFNSRQPVEACSRGVYFGKEGQTITGRTMDWFEEMHTDLWLFPRGIERSGGPGERGLKWTSRYGSVAASVYDSGTADGMNEKGLVANLLFLPEAEYPAAENCSRPLLAISAWTQYMLDNFETVEEAVAAMRQEPFCPVMVSHAGVEGRIHLAISDPSGDSAVFQYLGGKLVIFHGREYQALSNWPLRGPGSGLASLLKSAGAEALLPGSERLRQIKSCVNDAEQSADPRLAMTAMIGALRQVSVPHDCQSPVKGAEIYTLWRTASDQKQRVYFFEDAHNPDEPSLLWVQLAKLDFSPGSGIRRLPLQGQHECKENQTDRFQPSPPLKFLVSPEGKPKPVASP